MELNNTLEQINNNLILRKIEKKCDAHFQEMKLPNQRFEISSETVPFIFSVWDIMLSAVYKA